jgi:hypothetical protein
MQANGKKLLFYFVLRVHISHAIRDKTSVRNQMKRKLENKWKVHQHNVVECASFKWHSNCIMIHDMQKNFDQTPYRNIIGSKSAFHSLSVFAHKGKGNILICPCKAAAGVRNSHAVLEESEERILPE